MYQLVKLPLKCCTQAQLISERYYIEHVFIDTLLEYSQCRSVIVESSFPTLKHFSNL